MAANRPRFCAFGVRSMSDLPSTIISRMSSVEFITRTYPMLTKWGMRDEDVLVHSLGCSVWNLLGQELGFMAVAECPAPMTHGADIRPDSTWFCKQKRTPSVLIEFERFDGATRGRQKLDEKTCNLLEASMRWGNSPSVLILSAWSKGVVTAPDKEAIINRCRTGFKSTAGAEVIPSRDMAVLFNRFVFDVEPSGNLALTRTRCERLM